MYTCRDFSFVSKHSSLQGSRVTAVNWNCPFQPNESRRRILRNPLNQPATRNREPKQSRFDDPLFFSRLNDALKNHHRRGKIVSRRGTVAQSFFPPFRGGGEEGGGGSNHEQLLRPDNRGRANPLSIDPLSLSLSQRYTTLLQTE